MFVVFFRQMWKIFHTSLEWLNEGMPTLLWNDKQLCYSHAIWIEDAAVIYYFAITAVK